MAEPTFEFELKAGINSVSFGGDPRVVVEQGKPFKTTDPALAERARAHKHLTETTKPGVKKAAAEAVEAEKAKDDENGEAT